MTNDSDYNERLAKAIAEARARGFSETTIGIALGSIKRARRSSDKAVRSVHRD